MACPINQTHWIPPLPIFTISVGYLSLHSFSDAFHLQLFFPGMQRLNQRWEHEMAKIFCGYNSLTQIDLYHDHLPNLIKYLPQHKPFQ
jgi:hypothetical protein